MTDEGKARGQGPLVTFALFAYNQEGYIREAVQAAFAQSYQPLEIILSDDKSEDRTFETIKSLADAYSGPHKVAVRQSSANRGLASHLNEVLAIATGDIIVVAAGDDISLPNRVMDTVELFMHHPSAMAVLLSADLIDSSSKLVGEKILCANGVEAQSIDSLFRGKARTMGASRAFRRRLLDQFGPLDERCPTEDTPLLLRSFLCGESVLSSKKGVLYRLHSSNLSGAASLSLMKHDFIYSQYVRDFSVVAGEMPLSHVIGFYRWLAEDRCRRIAEYELDKTGRLEWRLLLAILASNSLRVKSKIKLLRKLLLKEVGL